MGHAKSQRDQGSAAESEWSEELKTKNQVESFRPMPATCPCCGEIGVKFEMYDCIRCINPDCRVRTFDVLDDDPRMKKPHEA